MRDFLAAKSIVKGCDAAHYPPNSTAGVREWEGDTVTWFCSLPCFLASKQPKTAPDTDEWAYWFGQMPYP